MSEAIVLFLFLMLVGFPMLSYAGDALRYLWYRIKEVTQK